MSRVVYIFDNSLTCFRTNFSIIENELLIAGRELMCKDTMHGLLMIISSGMKDIQNGLASAMLPIVMT